MVLMEILLRFRVIDDLYFALANQAERMGFDVQFSSVDEGAWPFMAVLNKMLSDMLVKG